MGCETTQNGTSTAGQRRAIVLAGRAHGFDVDALRAMTPAGSLRALSFSEASTLLDALNEGKGREQDKHRSPCEANADGSGSRPPTGGGPSRPRRPAYRRGRPGVLRIITQQQRTAIAAIQARLGYSGASVDDLCRKTCGVALAELASRRDASRLITVMQRVADWHDGRQGEAAPDILDKLVQQARVECV